MPGIALAEDPMPNIRALKETTTSGLMLSPGFGGGTANIEYQSLTGLDLALFDDSMQSMYQELVPHQKEPIRVESNLECRIRQIRFRGIPLVLQEHVSA